MIIKKYLMVLVAILLFAFSPQISQAWGGHAHYGYQGGHYAGGHGSSHKGGKYKNARTGNHYTHHK